MTHSSGFVARLGLAALLLFLFTACAVAPRKPDKLPPGDYGYLKSRVSWLVEKEIGKHGIRGVSIAVVDGSQTVWASGFGSADEATGRRADDGTLYRAGSITKLLTTFAIMRLAENGSLNLDDPLVRHIPGFSIQSRFPDARPITIRDLLTHHSGLPSDHAKGMWTLKPERFTSLIRLLKDEYVSSPPGLAFSYSNVGFSLLGVVIENVSGRRYEDYMREDILFPMGMKHSSFEIESSSEGLASKAYNGVKEERLWPLRDIPAGGFYSNVADLAKFIAWVNSGSGGIISRESLKETLKPQNVDVRLDFDQRLGLSWMLSWPGVDYAGPVAHHAGATIAHRSVLAVIPEHKLGVVVLSNTANSQALVNMVAAEALRIALEMKTGIKPPIPKKEPPPSLELDDAKLREYAGHYVAGPGFISVTARGGRLHAKMAGQSGEVELIPREGGIFTGLYKLMGFLPIYAKELDGFAVSVEKADGRTALLSVRNGRRFVIGEKIEPVPVSAEWLSRLGEYELTNLGDDFAGAPAKATLAYENGFLVVNSVSTFLGGARVGVPIKPVSDTEAVVYGLGRGRGETLRVIKRDGEEIAVFSGYEYKRKKKKG